MDRLGRGIAEVETRFPPTGEGRVLDLVVGRPPVTLFGRVLHQQRAVAGAFVEAQSGERVAQTKTTIDGRFELRLAEDANAVQVLVDDPRFALFGTAWTPGAARPQPLRIALQRAHALEVRVVDAMGGMLSAWIQPVDRRYDRVKEEIAPGHVRFRRLPPRPFVLRAGRGGREVRKAVDPANRPQVEIRLPD